MHGHAAERRLELGARRSSAAGSPRRRRPPRCSPSPSVRGRSRSDRRAARRRGRRRPRPSSARIRGTPRSTGAAPGRTSSSRSAPPRTRPASWFAWSEENSAVPRYMHRVSNAAGRGRADPGSGTGGSARRPRRRPCRSTFISRTLLLGPRAPLRTASAGSDQLLVVEPRVLLGLASPRGEEHLEQEVAHRLTEHDRCCEPLGRLRQARRAGGGSRAPLAPRAESSRGSSSVEGGRRSPASRPLIPAASTAPESPGRDSRCRRPA